MLLPGARVTLRVFDRGRIGFGFLSGLATMAWRMFNDLAEFLQKLVLKDNLLWGLTIGFIGYGYKSYYDYQQTRQSYHLSLTQSLSLSRLVLLL